MTELEGAGVSIVDGGTREIAGGVYLLRECVEVAPKRGLDEQDWYEPGTPLHGTQATYLVRGDDETLLFDTMTPPAGDLIVDNLDELLGEESLDYLVVSHPEANHAGNTGRILDAHPEATLVVPERGAHHALFGLDGDVEHVGEGDSLDLGGKVVDFHEPTFYDHAMTVWMSERTTNTLFTVDFFGYQHMAGDCLKFADELDHPVAPNQLDRFQGYAFFWLRFGDPDLAAAAVDDMMAEHDPDVIAPAHGNVIREDVDAEAEKMKDVLRGIAEQGDDYHIHTHQVLRQHN